MNEAAQARIDHNATEAMRAIMDNDTDKILKWETVAKSAYALAAEMEKARNELRKESDE